MALLSLVGLILSPLIDLVNAWIPNEKLRFLAAFVVCGVAGVVVDFLTLGTLTVEGTSERILSILGVNQVAYNLAYKNSPVQNKIRDLGGE